MCNISFLPERVTLNVSPFFDFILLTEREPIPECFNFQFKFLAEKNRIPEKDAGKIEVKSRKKNQEEDDGVETSESVGKDKLNRHTFWGQKKKGSKETKKERILC